MIAPLRGGDGVLGLLALGRFGEGYVDDDLRMAALCADFLAGIIAADARASRLHAGASREEAQADDPEDSLTGS